MDRYKKQRTEICEISHLLYERGYVVSNDGNISIRVSENMILITPSGVGKGRMTPEMLVLCDLDGNVIDGDRWPSSEIGMHFLIYKERPDVNSVVHAHPPVSTAFAVCRKPLKKHYLTETVTGLGEIPVAEFAMPSTEEVAESIMPFVHDHNALLLANHGSLAWGPTLISAFDRLETVEQTAKVFSNVESIGGGIEFTEEQTERLKSLSGHYRKLAGFNKDKQTEPSADALSIHVSLGSDDRSVVILDQTELPNRRVFLTLRTADEMYDAIKRLKVRGAPAIGIFAGYSMYVLLKEWREEDGNFKEYMHRIHEFLNSSRPTAVNLCKALDRMERKALEILRESGYRGGAVPEELFDLLRAECIAIHEEDIAMCKAISEYGLSLLKDGDGVLTHCNAGSLATSRYGTALGPIILGKERGMNLHVFADETRPLLQGARLTTWELMNAGVDVTLICDNMASIVMKSGRVQACFVGCDRIAANGDTANKIGTSGVAILAKHYGIPFYVLGPTSTIDMNCPDGDHIPIEERDPDEIRSMWYDEPKAPSGVKCYNPSFDVTDHELISGIITEKGICRPPYSVNLPLIFL